MKRTKRMKRWAILVALLTACIIAVASAYPRQTSELVQAYDAFFKVTGAAVGPLLALLGLIWSRMDKAELRDVAELKREAEVRAQIAAEQAERLKSEASESLERVRLLESDLKTIVDANQLWKLRRNEPFADYKAWKYDPRGAKIVTVALFKGGVGKTHLAANLAAYVSERRQKPVLLIDLDYQGSLSTMMLLAAGVEQEGSSVDALLHEAADWSVLSAKRVHLANHGLGVELNGGQGLGRAWIVPSQYSLTKVESDLMIERVIRPRQGLDERYRLAHLLLHPNVRREYSMIIIDTPPRMSLGVVNALVSSHSIIVPTIFDRISSEAIWPFLNQVSLLRSDLALDFRLAGIVGMLTRQEELTRVETQFRNRVVSAISDTAIGGEGGVLRHHLPRKAAITNSSDLGYFLSDDKGPLSERFYDPIFDELWDRIMSP